MATIVCPSCGKNVNISFDDCPFCNAPIDKSSVTPVKQEVDIDLPLSLSEKEYTKPKPKQDEGESKSGLCDICNAGIIKSHAHIVDTQLIRNATSKGFLPPIAKAMNDTFASFGISGRDMWKSTIEAGAGTNWALCNNCFKEVSDYANRSGCFIATAACLNRQAWEVITLSRFRDELLSKHHFGKSFINYYYRVSPGPAAYIARHKALRVVVRNLLIRPNATLVLLLLKLRGVLL